MFSSSRLFSSAKQAGDIFIRRAVVDKNTGERTLLSPLRCPGGPRMSSEDIKSLYRVPNAGHLAKYDWRFIMNLNTTHQLVKQLNRTKAVDKLYIELGPGAGMLTRSLLTLPSIGVFGIELDTKYNTSLDQIRAHSNGRFSWANADVTEIDEAGMLEEQFPEIATWLTETGRASTFVELRQKMQAMKQRRAVRDDRTRMFDDDVTGGVGVSDAELDEMLASDEDPTKQFNKNKSSSNKKEFSFSKEEILTSPFADEEDGDLGSNGPITGGSCEVTSTLWRGSPKIEVVGNLPFEIATDMSIRYAVDCSRRQNLFKYGRVPFHLFYQKEMAERIIAVPGSKNYGRTAVIMQNYFSIQVKKTFLERTYYPSTEVLGALLTLEPRITPVVEIDGAVLTNFCDIVLNPKMRYQTIFNVLQRAMPSEVALYILAELKIDGSISSTTISAPEISKMALMWIRYLEATNQGNNSEKPFQQSAKDVATQSKKRRAEDAEENLRAGLGLAEEEEGKSGEKKKQQSYW